MELTIFLMFLIALAGFIKGFVGFGLSLILISVLLEMGFSPVELLPILVPLFVILDILLYLENKKFVNLDFKENFTLHSTTLMTLFLGIIIGAYLLTLIEGTILKLIFSGLVLVTIFFLIEKVDLHQMRIPTERNNGIFGIISGVLTGLFTLNAVPVSIYLLFHQYPKDKYMGSLVTFLIFSDVILVAVYMYGGMFTYEGLNSSLKLIILVLFGFFAGSYVRRKVNSKYFKAIVIFILAVSSVKSIIDYFLF
jgi:uncharacterized membrane protein YfcA